MTGKEEEFSAAARERFVRPRNYVSLEHPDSAAVITGPCGDTMEIGLRIRDGKITGAGFQTDGCGSSRACGSMATELCLGRPVEEARRIDQTDILDALGGLPERARHCALLAAETLQAAIDQYEKSRNTAEADIS